MIISLATAILLALAALAASVILGAALTRYGGRYCLTRLPTEAA